VQLSQHRSVYFVTGEINGDDGPCRPGAPGNVVLTDQDQKLTGLTGPGNHCLNVLGRAGPGRA